MFLAAFIPALVGALAGVMASLVGRAIIALGVGFITYKGLGATVAWLHGRVVGSLQGLPADMVGLLGFLGLDQALSIIMSAVTTAISIRLIAGSFKKMILK